MVYTVELNCKKRGGRRKKLEKKSNGDIADRNCQHIEFRTSIQLITHIWQGRILTAQLPKGKQNLRCWNIGIDRSYVHRCFGEGKRERERAWFKKWFWTHNSSNTFTVINFNLIKIFVYSPFEIFDVILSRLEIMIAGSVVEWSIYSHWGAWTLNFVQWCCESSIWLHIKIALFNVFHFKGRRMWCTFTYNEEFEWFRILVSVFWIVLSFHSLVANILYINNCKFFLERVRI